MEEIGKEKRRSETKEILKYFLYNDLINLISEYIVFDTIGVQLMSIAKLNKNDYIFNKFFINDGKIIYKRWKYIIGMDMEFNKKYSVYKSKLDNITNIYVWNNNIYIISNNDLIITGMYGKIESKFKIDYYSRDIIVRDKIYISYYYSIYVYDLNGTCINIWNYGSDFNNFLITNNYLLLRRIQGISMYNMNNEYVGEFNIPINSFELAINNFELAINNDELFVCGVKRGTYKSELKILKYDIFNREWSDFSDGYTSPSYCNKLCNIEIFNNYLYMTVEINNWPKLLKYKLL